MCAITRQLFLKCIWGRCLGFVDVKLYNSFCQKLMKMFATSLQENSLKSDGIDN